MCGSKIWTYTAYKKKFSTSKMNVDMHADFSQRCKYVINVKNVYIRQQIGAASFHFPVSRHFTALAPLKSNPALHLYVAMSPTIQPLI